MALKRRRIHTCKGEEKLCYICFSGIGFFLRVTFWSLSEPFLSFFFCIEERQTRLVEEFMSGKLSFISKKIEIILFYIKLLALPTLSLTENMYIYLPKNAYLEYLG